MGRGLLLEHGHDSNTQESTLDKSLSGYAPLHWAAHQGQTAAVRALVKAGASLAARAQRAPAPPGGRAQA